MGLNRRSADAADGVLVPSQNAYRVLARYYLGLAKAEPSKADRYLALAADYFDRAGQVEGSPSAAQQQQQIQPPKDTR